MLSCSVMSKSFDPMDYSLPGSSVHGIFQARILSRLPFPSPGDLPDPGTKPISSALAGGFFTTAPSGKPFSKVGIKNKLSVALRVVIIKTKHMGSTECSAPYNYKLLRLHY